MSRGYLNNMKPFFNIVLPLLMLIISHSALATASYNDIRVLIDVSGSMKKTDPLNLRIPALKMLNGLIPDGSYAGVWNFGRDVNMTVKWGEVNKAWRRQADIGVTEIHSNGLHTNIESALAKATLDWVEADAKANRSVILLTDGQVDISTDMQVNKASRKMILSESIQALKRSGAKVHAIALSKDTDETLLKQLALETGGSFETAESAKELQKIFLKLFERATDPDMIELEGDKFTVDKSIKELTLLIFRPKGSMPTHLYPPDSTPISFQQKGKSIWRSEEGYDLITIKKPTVGIWKIDAHSDPDNKLMVVTDLKLKLNGVPAYISPSEPITIVAELHNKGKKISKNSFLRFVTFDLRHMDQKDSENQLSLIHSEVPKNKGQYVHQFDGSLAEGKHSFIVTIDSQTFNRGKRIDFEVQWPVKVNIRTIADPGTYRLTIEAREEYLMANTLQPDIQMKAPNGDHFALELNNNLGIWQAQFNANQAGLFQAHIKVSAQTINGEKQTYDLGRFSMVGVYKPVEIKIKSSKLSKVKNLKPVKADVNQLNKTVNKINWAQVMIIVGVSNLILILSIGGIFIVLRRRSKNESLSLDDELTDIVKSKEGEPFNV
jgi:uncharacterized protein (TIGR03503 family)